MPVWEPGAERLPEFQQENDNGPGVAQKPNDHREVDHLAQFFESREKARQAIIEKTGEECPGAQRNDGKVDGDIEPKPEIVVQSREVHGLIQNHAPGPDAPADHP